MTDDQGYGVSGTFMALSRRLRWTGITRAGLRYTQFHSTALCSPTRAALITGRNHHLVGFGVIMKCPPAIRAMILSLTGLKHKPEILKENGYATSWSGKNQHPTSLQRGRTF